MAKQSGGKSKRPASEKKKMARVSCRRRAAEQHERNAREQEARHRANVQAGVTPWQQASLERARSREAAGLYAQWASVYKELAGAQSELRNAFLVYIA